MSTRGVGAPDMSPLVFDLESAPLLNVRDYVDPPDVSNIKAPGNYKKAEAIEAYIAEEKVERLAKFERDCVEKAALDFNTARIVALGVCVNGASTARAVRDEQDEAEALEGFWAVARHRLLVGFRVREFDLPLMIQRSRYLGVAHLSPDLGRYARTSTVCDLFDVLTFNDLRAEALMKRSLKSFCRRFGIPVDDAVSGADVPALIAAGNWDAVQAHCVSDVALTVALAQRLGIVRAELPETVAI
jgi:hypothetical protein